MQKSTSNNQPFTTKQGQYLSFIFYYTKINGIPPAESDFQRYFEVTPATVHQTILRLEKMGLILRIKRKPRSITLAIPACQIPKLE